MAIPVRGSDGRIYYPVEYGKDGKVNILGLPAGENPMDYEVEEAIVELLAMGSGTHVAVKADDVSGCERRDWHDKGGIAKN